MRTQLARATTDTARSRLLAALGQAYADENLDSSRYFLNQSLYIAQQRHDSFAMARAMHQLGTVALYYARDEAKAVKWANEVIAVANVHGDNFHLAESYLLLSIVATHQHIGNPDELLRQALIYAQKAGTWKVLTDVYSVRFILQLNQYKYADAEKSILLALTACEQHDTDTWLTAGLDYCDVLDLQGKHTQSLTFARRLAAAKGGLQKSYGAFVYNNDLAALAKKLKNYAEAETLLLKGITTENRRAHPDSLHLYHYYRNLVGVYVQQKRWQQAYESGNELTTIRLWLDRKRQTQDSRLQMTQLKAASDLEKKENEISRLSVQQQQQRLLLIAALLITALLTGFVVVQQRNRRRIEGQKAELTRLNATKDKLFAILAHDLRSPVASLYDSLTQRDWGTLNQEEFVKATQTFNYSIRTLSNMLDNVLYWSLSQMNGLRPMRTRTHVAAVVQEQIHLLQPIATAKTICIKNDIPPDAYLLVDENHAAIIFRNLLHNALKFTQPGGRVHLTLTETDTLGQIIVSDTGVGIAPGQLDSLFSLDKRPDQPATANKTGTGLGLVVVSELVALNRGTLQVTSELNRGTTFTVAFAQSERLNLPSAVA